MKKLYAVAYLSLATLGLASSDAFAAGCCRCKCKKHCCYSYSICCRPYNAFSPICCGNMCCDGCCGQCQPSCGCNLTLGCGCAAGCAGGDCSCLGQLPAPGPAPVGPGVPSPVASPAPAPAPGTPGFSAPMPT